MIPLMPHVWTYTPATKNAATFDHDYLQELGFQSTLQNSAANDSTKSVASRHEVIIAAAGAMLLFSAFIVGMWIAKAGYESGYVCTPRSGAERGF